MGAPCCWSVGSFKHHYPRFSGAPPCLSRSQISLVLRGFSAHQRPAAGSGARSCARWRLPQDGFHRWIGAKSSGTYVCPTPGPGRAPRCPRDSSCRGGPQREGRSRTPLMYAVKQSDSAIVAVRPANKGARASAESEEPRAGLAGNLRGLDMGRTLSRVTCGTRSPSRYGRVRFSPDRHTRERSRMR